MPIEKGQEWGQPGVLPPSAPIATSDRTAAELAREHDIIGLSGGDLARTLGITPNYDRASPKHLVPIDAVEIELDTGERHLCIAHAVIGRSLFSGHVVAIMNAAFVGRRNIAPRAHPGDGKVDLITMRLGLAESIKAYRRMPTGSHLPHPGIETRRKASGTVELGTRLPVRIDGHRVGRTTTLRFTVVQNSVVVAVS